MKPIEELIQRDAGPRLQTDRGFPNGFWHPEDEEGAADVMLGCLRDLGLDSTVLPTSFIRTLVQRYGDEPDEDRARRSQIADAIAHVNAALDAGASPYRLVAFAEDVPGWESEEPVVMLLTEAERTLLLAKGIARRAE
jgi:hypothetical protein